MKRKLFYVLLLLAVLGSCNTVKKEHSEEEVVSEEYRPVPYEVAKGYFVNNTVDNVQVESLRITSQDQFDTYFGAATTMGSNGTPTIIDFKRSFVLALIGQETDKKTSFLLKGLIEKANALELSYSIEQEDEQRSFTTHPYIILVIDKAIEKDVHFIAE